LAHLSLYRKYRSQSFSDLIGQDHVVRTLQSALTSNRMAHAYLFTGPRGTGKTSAARLLAKALNCENGPTAEPCNQCDQCVSITIGNNPDVYEMDAASESGVEQVRETIVDVAEYQPMSGRFKIFIIDEVHDLSPKAFDALLKTIEEPPAHVKFILATTEYNKVPPTIRSRCQKYEFHRGTITDLVNRLEFVAQEEHADFDPAALSALARMADGGFRDALTLFEQALLTSEGRITLQHVYEQLGLIPEELVDGFLMAIKTCDPAKIMELSSEVARLGRDPRSILESMEYRLADLTRAAYGVEIGATSDSAREASLHETAANLGRDALLTLRGAIAEAHRSIRDVSLPRLWLEAELIRVGRMITAPQQSFAAPQAQPQVQQPKPKPQALAPAPQPKPEAPPVAAVVEAEPASNGSAAKEVPVVHAVEPSGNPELDDARKLWAEGLQQLPAGAPITLKLHDSVVIEVSGDELTVQMARQMDCDWILDKPVRANHVLQLLAKISGRTISVKYVVGTRADAEPEASAVELPMEGSRLHEAAKNILGA
jgi:DNA polymerase-3 subunit gamma/tau